MLIDDPSTYAAVERAGRQSQCWVKIDGDWKVVAAHVSWMDA